MGLPTRIAAAALAAALAAGCTARGPEVLGATRGHYNEAIQRTNAEQLLLNLVRLRYRDTPYFLEVASVTTSYDFTGSAGAGASMPREAPNTITASASLRWSEKPTLSFTPLQGDKFVRQFLTPVDMDTLLLLSLSGWSTERLFTVLLNEMNGLSNARRASGPTPDEEPEFRGFREAARLMWEIQKREGLHFGAEGKEDGGVRVTLVLEPGERASPEAARLLDLLGLDPGAASWPLERGLGRSDGRSLWVVPRSLQSAMFFLSQGVEVPAEDLEAGRVTRTAAADGGDFDWHEVTDGILRVRSGGRPPGDAAVAIPYRGHWFWIADDDLSSKSTLALVAQVFSLQAGGTPSTGPVLTLAVGQ